MREMKQVKTFREFITEGMSASITVFDGRLYKTSYLQYDAIEAARELIKKYNTPRKAQKLVQGTGEIRDIFNLEYYDDRVILEVTKDVEKAVKNANKMNIKYYFDGGSWYQGKGEIDSFEELILI